MSLLVTGSIGIDTIESPAGKRESVIGGSAVYFSFAASHFVPVRLVGVVGEDCPPALLKVFDGRRRRAQGVCPVQSRQLRAHGKRPEAASRDREIRLGGCPMRGLAAQGRLRAAFGRRPMLGCGRPDPQRGA